MQPDKFTIKSQEALQAAQRLADERRNPQTTPEHLLAVLLEQEGGVVAPVLSKLGVAPAAVRERLTPALDALPTLSGGSSHLARDRRVPRPEGSDRPVEARVVLHSRRRGGRMSDERDEGTVVELLLREPEIVAWLDDHRPPPDEPHDDDEPLHAA